MVNRKDFRPSTQNISISDKDRNLIKSNKVYHIKTVYSYDILGRKHYKKYVDNKLVASGIVKKNTVNKTKKQLKSERKKEYEKYNREYQND